MDKRRLAVTPNQIQMCVSVWPDSPAVCSVRVVGRRWSGSSHQPWCSCHKKVPVVLKGIWVWRVASFSQSRMLRDKMLRASLISEDKLVKSLGRLVTTVNRSRQEVRHICGQCCHNFRCWRRRQANQGVTRETRPRTLMQ